MNKSAYLAVRNEKMHFSSRLYGEAVTLADTKFINKNFITMKKFIIGTLGVLFASAIAVAVWTSNVKANDLLAMNISALAGENVDLPTVQVSYEAIGYTKGFSGTNWREKDVQCIQQIAYPVSSTTRSTQSMDSSASVNAQLSMIGDIPVPKVGADLGTNASNSSETTTNWTYDYASKFIKACGKGTGKCQDPAYDNPCQVYW